MLTDLGEPGFGFFDFTVPGLAIALPGLVFALLVVRRLLPERSAAGSQGLATGRQFLAQIDVVAGRPLDGLRPAAGFFPDLADVTVHAIRRGEARLLPPFGGEAALSPGDILIVSATRQALTDAVRVVRWTCCILRSATAGRHARTRRTAGRPGCAGASFWARCW